MLELVKRPHAGPVLPPSRSAGVSQERPEGLSDCNHHDVSPALRLKPPTMTHNTAQPGTMLSAMTRRKRARALPPSYRRGLLPRQQVTMLHKADSARNHS